MEMKEPTAVPERGQMQENMDRLNEEFEEGWPLALLGLFSCE